ncbi:MAG: hypothetical protein SFV81_25640 [Pirellulaceae bacterium]|nr:hypothetical protein [Pirellulaceae bacterium]
MASRKSKTRKQRGRQAPRPVPVSSMAATRNSPEKELAGLKPKPASNERVEDLAVFSNVGREQLSDALKPECTAVMEALDAVVDGDFARADERLKEIPRSSPYADWRLFVRGLGGFYAKDFETAKQNWQRLDVTRRPARIANTLYSAETLQTLDGFAAPPKRLVDGAKLLLHRSNALAAAKQILSVKHRDSEVLFSNSQVAMLQNFRDDFRQVDADFVAKVSQACVYLACQQEDPNAFMLLKRSVPGPAHDPRWNLQEFLFLGDFEYVEEIRQATAKAYIEKDLPGVAQFSIEQKNAIASLMFLELARRLNADQSGMQFFVFSDPPDYKAIEKLLGEAIKKYPANQEAHKLLFDILNAQIESRRRQPKAEIEAAEKRLIEAKEAYVSAFPAAIEISLELVDHYFETDEHDKADALVKQLTSQRLDAPLAKALPWKLKVLNAMHASRKKAEMSLAREALAIVESLWPTWLARTWLPFLKAALELRAGNQAQFEAIDKEARQVAGTSQVAGDFMAFAAIQQMNVPAAVIKPYRETIAKYLDSVEQMPLSDLISVAAFFWDLTRSGLEHKGFRLQAAKVGKAICLRLKKGETVPYSSEFVHASCLCAGRGYWPNGNDAKQPAWAETLSKTEPKVGAVYLRWLTNLSYSGPTLTIYKPLIDAIQAAAKTEKDPFYRYLLEQTALSANEAFEEFKRSRSSSMTSRMFGFGATAGDDEEECQCEQCRANRAREAKRNSRAAKRSKPAGVPKPRQPMFDFGDDDDFDNDDFEDGVDDADDETEIFDHSADYLAAMTRIASLLGPEKMSSFVVQFSQLTNDIDGASPAELLRKIAQVFKRFDLPHAEAVRFLRTIGQNTLEGGTAEFENVLNDSIDDSIDDSSEALLALPQQPVPQQPMTAEERKAADKQRRRELEKKRRR